ncbi:ABC transporter permease [Salinibacterium hongtaonis]|uniref:ABC transporter permease n=1 Tax=Homoserinimonas hongtaonis TaxID=2079791 RepID=A0A2U1T2C2_9MICO|nr:ABC transporter permease [Salinibacterium hongtaonis]AWB88280.1 ABC transporter permease [Salinibacterium hongtaonis]PWB98034.1 ABC transporter permease [Salinibacterium hongtaonis]
MTTTSTIVVAEDPSVMVRVWRRLLGVQKEFPVLQLLAVAVILVIGANALPGLLNPSSIRLMLVMAAITGIAALGQTLVIIVGGIDLSIASMIGAGALAISQLPSITGLDFWVIFVGVIVGAGVIGAGVGYVSHRFDLNPLIISLGAGAIALGIALVLTGGSFTGTAPAWLGKFMSPISTTFGLPIPPVVSLWIVIAIVMFVLFTWTATGRRLSAVGTNRKAADLTLIRSRKMWVIVFMVSAIGSAVVGILLAGYSGSADLTLGNTYMFQSLAAVVVGGTMMGGKGDYNRTITGALLITALNTVLIGIGFSYADQQILFGLVILGAVVAYGRERKLRDRI